MVFSRLIDRSLTDLRAVGDPYERLRAAEEFDGALVTARSTVTLIKRDAVNELRNQKSGYGRIAERLGVSKARVQQIANTSNRLGPVAYAVRDEDGHWYGETDLLARTQYREASMPQPFTPGDEFNPLFGQVLTVRYGEVDDGHPVTVQSIHIVDAGGRTTALRMTVPVMDALFGPPIEGTPERNDWKAKREQRKRALGKEHIE